MPKIRFTKIEGASKGSFEGFNVIGNDVVSGKEWTTFIFKNHKDLKTLKELSQGDIVDVKMIKNGKYWNADKFVKESGADAPTVDAAKKTYTKTSNVNNAQFRDPIEIIRGEALTQAVKCLELLITDPENRVFKKTSKEDFIISKTIEWAQKFEGYITGKTVSIGDVTADSSDLEGLEETDYPGGME